MGMDNASPHTIATEQQLLADIKAQGHGFATQAAARRLVRDGLVVRISGKGKGMGNTPTWGATPALVATWDDEVAEGATRMVTCLGGTWPVVDERDGEVCIMRRRDRMWVPAKMCK